MSENKEKMKAELGNEMDGDILRTIFVASECDQRIQSCKNDLSLNKLIVEQFTKVFDHAHTLLIKFRDVYLH